MYIYIYIEREICIHIYIERERDIVSYVIIVWYGMSGRSAREEPEVPFNVMYD